MKWLKVAAQVVLALATAFGAKKASEGWSRRRLKREQDDLERENVELRERLREMGKE